ncbi:glycoside hydrolase family 3 C-terminal domain-containing protein [bacterium]|nr:glycoside hydrolase family 3 C-terminal domain-containing protein [bacterium]
MTNNKIIISFFTTVLLATACKQNTNSIETDPLENKIDSVLSLMTLREKIGQMTQINLTVIAKGPNKWASNDTMEIDFQKAKKAIVDYHVGSVLNTVNNLAQTPATWYSNISDIQKIAMDSTNIKIPVIYGIDAIHGATYTDGATMFPQQISTAATWNPQHAYNMAKVCAYETRACGIPWNFSPVLDLGIDPRFPRQFETFGEDPLLVTEFGKAMIAGYQGKETNIGNEYVAACMKHFTGYQATISGKDRTPAYIPDNVLFEYHIKSFKSAIDAGAKTVMINSGIINGESVHASYKLLTEILRNKLGFEGVILTDWEDINKLCDRDKVAVNRKEAIEIAINAGIDMSMVPYEYEEFTDYLFELVEEGKVKMSRIDDATRKILKLKFELGLFKTPVTNYQDYPKFGSEESNKLAYESASESITLLKNKNSILPLKKGSKILVTGPNANTMNSLNGAWTYNWQGKYTDRYVDGVPANLMSTVEKEGNMNSKVVKDNLTPKAYNTIYEAFTKSYGEENISFIPGVSYKKNGSFYDMTEDDIQQVVDAAKNHDYVLLCLGENCYTEKPGDLNDLNLHKLQLKLANKLSECGKPIILVLNIGRPRLISEIEPFMSAVLNIYLPGNLGADALVDIIDGKVNPSGKLPYTFPAFPNSLTTYYYKPSEVQNNSQGAYNYVGKLNNLYEFGYGLSYTNFEYKDITIENDSINPDDSLSISLTVYNSGDVDGQEIVQVYVSDLFASITPDNKRLRAFDKVFIKSGESKKVSFSISAKDFSFVNLENKYVLESGDFTVHVGGNSKDLTSLNFFVR